MRNVLVLMMAVLACALVGCSQTYQWSRKHPDYKQAPYGELAVAGVQDAFVLTRSGWFAKRLNVSSDSIQILGTQFCAQTMLNELKGGYSHLNILPENALANAPEESQKLDDRIFMKGKLPEQGVVIKDSAGNVPPVILIIHEAIVGTDLNRESFFDYALIHNESPERTAAKNISAIVSYTLWDNIKQRPLFSAVDEIQRPVLLMSWDELAALVRQSVIEIRKNLFLGAK